MYKTMDEINRLPKSESYDELDIYYKRIHEIQDVMKQLGCTILSDRYSLCENYLNKDIYDKVVQMKMLDTAAWLAYTSGMKSAQSKIDSITKSYKRPTKLEQVLIDELLQFLYKYDDFKINHCNRDEFIYESGIIEKKISEYDNAKYEKIYCK